MAEFVEEPPSKENLLQTCPNDVVQFYKNDSCLDILACYVFYLSVCVLPTLGVTMLFWAPRWFTVAYTVWMLSTNVIMLYFGRVNEVRQKQPFSLSFFAKFAIRYHACSVLIDSEAKEELEATRGKPYLFAACPHGRLIY